MRALPSVNALAKARPATIHKLWEGLGYYTRVRNIQKAAQEIMARHGGKFPQDYEAILELPGIGRYTAGAIASIAFNEPRAILDGNVMRVLARIFGIEGNAREKPANEELWRLAQEMVRDFEPERDYRSNPRYKEIEMTKSGLKKLVERAGLDPAKYAGHSLRAGHATSAAIAGASERSIMNQTGHKSVQMVRRYIREGTLFRENSARKLGL